MNFLKYGFVVLVIFAVFSGQAEAGRSKNMGRRIAHGRRRVVSAFERVQPHIQRIGQARYNFGRYTPVGEEPIIEDGTDSVVSNDHPVSEENYASSELE